MEEVLKEINKQFIKLPDAEKKRNNAVLMAILKIILSKMAKEDVLFDEMYNRPYYGGSYFEGLKIGHADEYDVDLLLIIPEAIEATLFENDEPGFVYIRFLRYFPELRKRTSQHKRSNFRPQGPPPKFRGFQCLLDEHNYLDTTKVSSWMERVIQRTLNTFSKPRNGSYTINTEHGNIFAKIKKSGPAFTLKINGTDTLWDVDLVPCFLFGENDWPKGYRSNPVRDEELGFFAVPKNPTNIPNSNHFWKLSFQKQERFIMQGMEKLKPAIKLLKKMRDKLDHNCIASYYIKTVGLWLLDENDRATLNRSSLSFVFMKLLKKYESCLKDNCIPYYWDKRHNLTSEYNLENVYHQISNIIQDVETSNDPFRIAKYLVTPAEETELRTLSNI